MGWYVNWKIHQFYNIPIRHFSTGLSIGVASTPWVLQYGVAFPPFTNKIFKTVALFSLILYPNQPEVNWFPFW